MEILEDNHLMLKVKQGDLDKMGLLFERHHKKVYAFIYRNIHDVQISEDLVQNVFYRMIKYCHTFKGEGNFLTWMYHLTRNVMHDHYKKNNINIDADILKDEKHMPLDDQWADHLIVAQQNHSIIEMALTKLPPSLREIILLSKFQELNYKEIADIIGTTEGNVKVKVHRAIGELKKLIIKLNE